MANLIKLKRTNTALAVPSLVFGELGYNSADGKLYVGNFSDVATQVGAGGSGTVTTLSIVTANGVSGSVATATTTPAITVTLGAITPSSVTVSGVITASAGSVALPSITTSGDTNTGIYFPAADSVSTSVGGVEKLRVDSNGVGLAVREDGGIAPSSYYLTTQAQAGLTILHAAKGGSELSSYQPKRHLMAYGVYLDSANGIMRIKIPANSSNMLCVTIKSSQIDSAAFSRNWQITLCDYYLAGYGFTPNTFSVTGSPNFSRVRLMTDGTYRYLVLGNITTGAGTVATVSGNTTVTGTSSKFQTLFRVGDAILINASWSYVSAITSDTVLTVAANNSGTNTGVVYSRGDSFITPQVTVDVDVLGSTTTPIQINTAFSVDIAETESGLSLVSAANDFSLTNTSSQHSFVGIGTQRPTNLLHVAQEKTGVGTVSNGAAGTTVTGVNTLFLDTFKIGDTITIPSAGTAATPQTVVISAIASNTSMTTAAITSANSAVSYSLVGGTLFSVAGNGKMTAAIASTLSGGRLTLETGVAVSSSDQTAKTTIYYTPFVHSLIGLYDTTNLIWTAHPFTERSLALGTLVSGKNYDVFAVLTSGAVAIEALVWTSDSVRATALVAVDGVLCKTGDTSRRYVGTFRTTTTTTTEDSEAKRFVYNANNKVPRAMLGTLGYVDNSTQNTFTFLSTLSTFAPINGGTGNKCEFVNGLTETVFLSATAFYTAGASTTCIVGIGIDTTTGVLFNTACNETAGSNVFSRTGSRIVQFAAGYHYSSLNGATIDVSTAATFHRDQTRMGSAADPLRTFISGSINS